MSHLLILVRLDDRGFTHLTSLPFEREPNVYLILIWIQSSIKALSALTLSFICSNEIKDPLSQPSGILI